MRRHTSYPTFHPGRIAGKISILSVPGRPHAVQSRIDRHADVVDPDDDGRLRTDELHAADPFAQRGWSTFIISVIATGYTFGFTVSCVVTPIFVRRVGHVRVFGALITLLTVSILLCALVVEWWAWMLFRGLSGFAIAGAYLLIESWLNERVTNDNRGALFSVYMVTCLVGSIGGQYIVPLGDVNAPDLFMICALIFSLALFPVALSTAQSPTPIAEARFDLKRLYRRSPIAFFGSLLSGALSGTWGSLGGVYSQTIGMNTAQGATLLAAFLAGGALSQVPIGRISDRMDRRRVMIACGCSASAPAGR